MEEELLDLHRPILRDESFKPLLDHLKGRRCELILNPFGNCGDRLIEIGFLQLFGRNDIEIVRMTKTRAFIPPDPSADTLLFYGGGSVGDFYEASPYLRKCYRGAGIPKVLLPQSAINPREDLSHFEKIFAREETSFQIMKNMGDCKMAPDGALALDPVAFLRDFKEIISRTPKFHTGVFLRHDDEKVRYAVYQRKNVCDASGLKNFRRFLTLPSNYLKIITDRLHFAIWALIMRNEVTLLANSYHKNSSMYSTWFKDPGLTPFASLINFDEHPA